MQYSVGLKSSSIDDMHAYGSLCNIVSAWNMVACSVSPAKVHTSTSVCQLTDTDVNVIHAETLREFCYGT